MDISLLTYKLIYTYTHTPPGTDSGHLAQSVTIFLLFFFFFNLLTPGRHRHQTGISITFCHCCNATFGGLLPYNQQIHTEDVADLFLSFLIILISTLSRFQYVSSFLLFCLSSLSSSLRVLSFFFFFGALSCRVLVMQILTCSFGLLAINWNQQIDGSNSCSLATWYISRANIRTCQCSVIDTV